jgi:uncharacterized protein (TIGR03067 family)
MFCQAAVWPALLLVAAGPVEKPSPARESDALQGTWRAVVIEKAGKKEADAALKTVTVVIKDNRFALKSRDKVIEEVTLKLDPAKDPPHVTLTPVRGPRKDRPHPGIYAAEKGRLKICWAPPGKERPAAFATAADNGNFLIVLERVETKP